jgi:hypothetical protein
VAYQRITKRIEKKGSNTMRRTWIVLAAMATTLAVSVPLAQAQEGKTVGGHIGVVLPLVTHTGGHTTNDLADQFSIGLPVGITVKGSGRLAFDLELDPFVNTAPTRQTTVAVHPGLVWNVGHGWGAGGRMAFDITSSDWGFTPLVSHSWGFGSESGFFKTYFIEADLPVRFSRPTGGPATNAVTFAIHAGLGF